MSPARVLVVETPPSPLLEPVRPSLRIRTLTSGDLPFADGLRDAVGWNQTLDDWRRFLALEPDGCFLAEQDGEPAGTATTLVYGRDLAWIGMVLVDPRFRRLGIGNAMLRHCIDYLRLRGVVCIGLDATPLGLPVYERLGFRSAWSLSRWEHPGWLPGAALPESTARDGVCWKVRPWTLDDAGSGSPCGALDLRAFGVSRSRLVEVLGRRSRRGWVVSDAQERPRGYGMIRAGARANYLGPVVADAEASGACLLDAVLGNLSGERVFWDIPEPNVGALRRAVELGFTRQRDLTRMFLGGPAPVAELAHLWALSAPETG